MIDIISSIVTAISNFLGEALALVTGSITGGEAPADQTL